MLAVEGEGACARAVELVVVADLHGGPPEEYGVEDRLVDLAEDVGSELGWRRPPPWM